MGLKLFIKEHKTFCILHILCFVLGGVPFLILDKVAFFVWLNQFHHPIADSFFYYVSYLGSSAAYALLMTILFVLGSNSRTLLIGISSFVTMSVIVQGMKRIVYVSQLRPIACIPEGVPIHLVKGVIRDIHFSLPSGHAATIFTVACFVHLLMRAQCVWRSVFLFVGATLVAYARVYLCQHFYTDIYVGAWLGTCITILMYSVLIQWKGPAWLDQQPSLRWLWIKRKVGY